MKHGRLASFECDVIEISFNQFPCFLLPSVPFQVFSEVNSLHLLSQNKTCFNIFANLLRLCLPSLTMLSLNTYLKTLIEFSLSLLPSKVAPGADICLIPHGLWRQAPAFQPTAAPLFKRGS